MHTTSEEFQKLNNQGQGNSHNYHDYIKKFRFQNVFHPHNNEKPAIYNFTGLNSVFEKLCFGGGLVWMGTVGQTVQIKRAFQVFRRSVEAALFTSRLYIRILIRERFEIQLSIKIHTSFKNFGIFLKYF